MDISGFALVTGAASGIGKACAKSLAKEGAAGIALIDLNEDGLTAVKREIQNAHTAAGGVSCQIDIYPANITDETAIDQIVSTIANKFGRLDYVVNAAGIGFKHEGGAAFVKTKDWQRVLDVNLNGSFYILRAAAKIMLKQEPILSTIDKRPLQRGSIVNLASILGAVGVPLSTAYTASKHAIIGLTKTASEDYAKDGLRFDAICPGYIETPLTVNDPVILEIMKERVANHVPMKRMGQPQEVADSVVYLCGGRSSFITGTALFVDGGYTQR